MRRMKIMITFLWITFKAVITCLSVLWPVKAETMLDLKEHPSKGQVTVSRVLKCVFE